jgi:DNA-directed RNA polymerase sigma subunit (sigma70/sigma32)
MRKGEKAFANNCLEPYLIDILRQIVKWLKNILSDKERTVLDEQLIVETPLSLQSIGKMYGITNERVRQIE